jgi:hypothetical protein
MAGPLIAILIFLLIAGILALLGLRQMGKASQFVTMTIFSAAILFGMAAIATLTFLNINGHT